VIGEHWQRSKRRGSYRTLPDLRRTFHEVHVRYEGARTDTGRAQRQVSFDPKRNCPRFPVFEFEATVWFWELDPLDAHLIRFVGGHSLGCQPQRKLHKGKMNNSDVIIVGAGPAGLACAASMDARGLNATVLEKENTVGSVWRRHYDRLHLHTDRGHSGLPGMAMSRTYPTYPSREQVVEYLEDYRAHFRLQPVFNTTVLKIELSPEVGDGGNRKGGISWGCLTPPLLHRRSDMPCPTITSSI
jgi:hypothetical protein